MEGARDGMDSEQTACVEGWVEAGRRDRESPEGSDAAMGGETAFGIPASVGGPEAQALLPPDIPGCTVRVSGAPGG